MKKLILLGLFMLVGNFVFLSNSSSAAASCSPASSYNSTTITAYAYRTGSVSGPCTAYSSPKSVSAYSGTFSTSYSGQSAVVNCGSTGAGLVYYGNTSCSGSAAGYSGGACVTQTVTCTTPTPTPAPLPTCNSGPISWGFCGSSCTQPGTYTTYSGGGSCTQVSGNAGTQSCTGGSCPSSCPTIGATQCWNGATGYCDTSHLYYQTCTSAGWSNSTNCPSGEYPYAFGTLGGGCTSACSGHGGTCSSSCSNPIPNYTQYTNPNYACSTAGTTCCGAAATATPTPTPMQCTCYGCSSSSCVSYSVSGTCSSNGLSTSCPTCGTCTPNTGVCNGLTCGSVWNGCYYQSCGTCSASQTCTNNQCIAAATPTPGGYCGDGVVEPPEQCDTGTNNFNCPSSSQCNSNPNTPGCINQVWCSASCTTESCYNSCTGGPYGVYVYAFYDTNGNGVKDTGEASDTVDNFGVTLGGQSINSLYIGGVYQGYHWRGSFFPGSYPSPTAFALGVTPPSGYTLTNYSSGYVFWPCGTLTINLGFGIAPTPTPAPTYNISGNVYNDVNGDGVQDCVNPLVTNYPTCTGSSPETNVTGANISSTALSTGTTLKATTTSSGYSFTGLASDTYTLSVTPPAGYTLSAGDTNPKTVTIPPNQSVNFGLQKIPTYTISGSIYIDADKNGVKDIPPDSYYTATSLPIVISCISSSCNGYYTTVNTSTANGSFTTGSTLPAGQYTISLASLPSGFQATAPTPPAYTVTVGPGCTAPSPLTCDASGNITLADYGITNSLPWIQTTSGDITGVGVANPSQGGLNDPIPSSATCGGGAYASVAPGAGGTPGVIYSGASGSNFGQGQASVNNWIVGGNTYPDVYQPTTPGVIPTSYAYIDSLAQQSGVTETPITSVSGCSTTSPGNFSCTSLPSAPGVYKANGNLTITGSSLTFPSSGNFVILVNGDLNIDSEIHVPVGSTALFTAAGNINIGSTVGTSTINSTTTQIEGYYSTDKNFNVLGGNTCPTPDLKLNIGGSVVVNAALNGGTFNNKRDLCAGDQTCPAVTIQERPDFILNSPDLFKLQRRVWQEVAP